MIKFINQILSLCTIFFFASTNAQINSGFDNQWRDEFVVKNWNIETGLPQNTIKSILQTRDGYLWFGTFGGLVRFDGIKFQLYNSGTNSELNNDRVLNLLENGSHLLVGFERGGIYKFEKGVFSRIDKLRFLDRESVIGLVRDNLNNIWIHTVEKGIHRYHNNSIESFFKDEVAKNNTITLLDRKGNLFFYHNDVCYYYNGTDFQPSIFKFKLQTEPLVHPFFDRENKLFIVTPNSDFQIFDSTGNIEYLPNSKRFSLTTRKINQDSQLRYWLMTTNGLVLYKDDGYQYYSKNDGIKDNEILTFFEDKENNFWLGSKTKGIFKLKVNPIKTILKQNENSINNYTSVVQTKSGKILAGVNCGGVVMTDLNSPPIQLRFSVEGDTRCTWSLLEDSKGNLWIGTWGGGVFRLPNWENNHNNSALLKNFLNKINAKVVLAIAEDKGGNLWFGSLNNGVFKLDVTGNVKRFSTDDGLPSNEIRCFLPFDDGSMWIGTGSGISKIVDDKVQDFNQIKDLPTKQVRSLYLDDDQTLWIGTNGEGLIRFKNNKAFRINATNGLYDNLVSQIIEDKQNRLWMGSNKGISFINKSEVKSLAEGKIDFLSTGYFTAQNGMVNSETNGGFYPSAFIDKFDNIWFPTVSGLAVVNQKKVKQNIHQPNIIIENILLDQVPIEVADTLIIPYQHQTLHISFTSLSFSESDRNKFKFILEGINDKWFNAETRREAIYTKLPPGTYRFNVIASNNDGIWNNEGKSIYIIVQPPFWLTNWFLGIIGLIFVSVGPSFYLWRINLLMKKALRREALSKQLIELQEVERKRIAAEIHDSLSQNILLIKNRAQLALINNSSLTNINEQLNEITALAADTLDEARKITHNLRPIQLDRLGLTEAIKQLIENVRRASEFQIETEIENVDGLIEKDSEIILFRIIQEIMNNILKHSKASEVNVIVGVEGSKVRLYIEDNGVGFNSEEFLKQEKINKGFGLNGLSERVRILKGELHIKSEISNGTKVIIFIPLLENKIDE